MRAPAALIALPLLAGSAAGLLSDGRVPPGIELAAAVSGLLGALSAVASLLDGQRSGVVAAAIAGSLVVGLSMGAGAARRAYHPSLQQWFHAAGATGVSAAIEGRLREDAAPGASGVALLIEVARVVVPRGDERGVALEIAGGVRLTVAGERAASAMGAWRAGRTVRTTATLREPAVYLDPGVPDERRALLRRGIALVGTVKSAALVEVIAHGSPLDEWASAVRAGARSAIGRTVGRWSPRSAGVAAAIVIGDRSGLAQDDERRLQDAGIYHVIAISGGNIAILTLMLLGTLRWLRASPRLAAVTAVLLLLFYGRMTGASASVERAITAAVVVLAGRLIDQRASPLNVLAAAAILAVSAAPAAVFDLGFVLSFGATLAILIGVPRLEPRVVTQPGRRSRGTWLRVPIALLAATLSVEVALGPISAALFSRVTVAGLLLNFVAIPLMTVVQAGALVTLALSSAAPELALRTGYLVHLAARGLVDSARLVDAVPWLARDVAPSAWTILAAYYSALVLSLFKTRLAPAAALTCAFLGAVIAIGPHAAARDRVAAPAAGVLRVVFLDVGQGDATLVVPPDGRALLVDAGGLPIAPLQDPSDGPAFNIGERVIAPALRALGIRSLDTVVITHPDPDHIGGARTILRRFAPRAIWEGVPVPPHPARRALRAAAAEHGLEWRTVTAGDRVEIAGVEIAVLHPPLPDWERQRVRNDDSVVLSVRYGSVAVILPGDIGREGESRALAHVEHAPITIVKAPHHGSATSSTLEFVSALQPRAVIFSAGRRNHFGHPAPSVVARYRAIGAALFSTAEDGAVILETDGRTVMLRGWTGRTLSIGGVH
jgi:competence protein ComEC